MPKINDYLKIPVLIELSITLDNINPVSISPYTVSLSGFPWHPTLLELSSNSLFSMQMLLFLPTWLKYWCFQGFLPQLLLLFSLSLDDLFSSFRLLPIF